MIVGRKDGSAKFNALVFIISLMLVLITILLRVNFIMSLEVLGIGAFIALYIYSNEKRLLVFAVLGILFTPTLSLVVGALSNLPYLIIAVLCIKLLEKKLLHREKIRFNKIIIGLTLILFLINILSLIYNQYNVSLVLFTFYSLKKFAFIILYLFFINVNVSKADLKKVLYIIVMFGLFQFIAVAIQFAGGVRQDALGGMFGEFSTGVMIQFLSIILILVTVFDNKLNKLPFGDLIIMLFCLIYSAMGEVKLGLIVIPIIYFITLMLKRNKTKFIVSAIVVGLSFGVILSFLSVLYPGSNIFSDLTSTEDYLQNAYGKDSINRTGFLPLLKATILDTEEKQLFGTGLATINPSKVNALAGPLIPKYGYLNIHFFALPYSVTENGILGTIVWLMIYVYILIINIKEYLFAKSNKSIVNIVLIIDTFIFMVYNNSILVSVHIVLILWVLISYFNDTGKINTD